MRLSLFAAAVFAVAAAVGYASRTDAQGPPTRFFGQLTIDGRRAPLGTRVIAEINGKDCSGAPQTPNNTASPNDPLYVDYIVNALDSATIPGCGKFGDIVFFRVDTRYAAQTSEYDGGNFKEVNLTITGAGLKPVVAQASPSPSPTPAATPTPTATSTPTPTPSSAPMFTVALLDFNTPCIPASGQVVCDASRSALWNGDQTAWAARYQAQGRPAPTPDEVFAQTFGFRVEANDPAAVAAVAQGLGWAHLRITGARFRGTPPSEGDEWVEVKNVGGLGQDMTGWSVRVDDTPVRWTFQDGFTLAAGQSCRFYTGVARADSCPGSANISVAGVLPDEVGSLSLWVDYFNLLAVRVRYAANPTAQPPPPNLQGAQ